MKTTLDLRDDLLTRAKTQAAREQISLTKFIEEGMRLRLRPLRQKQQRMSLPKLPLSPHAGGFQPGIDPNCNRSLFEAAEK